MDFFNFIYSIVGTPLGYVMWVLYLAVNNFGVAVILFTLVVKLASFPLTLKQQRNMAFSQLFTPRVQEIQKKYKKDQQKMQEEMQKLQKEGYNPMGGCGPMILVFIILFGVIDVVYKPMTHIERFDWVEKGSTETVIEIAKQTDYASVILGSEEDQELLLEFIKEKDGNADFNMISDDNPQITLSADFTMVRKTGVTSKERSEIGKFVAENILNITGKSSRFSSVVKNELNMVTNTYKGMQGELYAVQSYNNNNEAFLTPEIHSEIYEKLEKLQKNMDFFGIDLGRTPKTEADPIIIIPILAFILSGVQIYLSMLIQRKTMPNMPNMPGGKAMLVIMPFFSLFLAFQVPAGAGLYWGISYLFGIGQTIVMYKFWPPEKMRTQAAEKAKLKSVAFQTTATVTEVDESGETVEKSVRLSDMSAKEQKEYYKKKLEQARLEDAKKYGEIPGSSGDNIGDDN